MPTPSERHGSPPSWHRPAVPWWECVLDTSRTRPGLSPHTLTLWLTSFTGATTRRFLLEACPEILPQSLCGLLTTSRRALLLAYSGPNLSSHCEIHVPQLPRTRPGRVLDHLPQHTFTLCTPRAARRFQWGNAVPVSEKAGLVAHTTPRSAFFLAQARCRPVVRRARNAPRSCSDALWTRSESHRK